jgi:hypothetical protein
MSHSLRDIQQIDTPAEVELLQSQSALANFRQTSGEHISRA